MKFIFIGLILILISLDVVFSDTELDQYLVRAKIESELCHTHQEVLGKSLILLSLKESVQKKRKYDAPKDLKLAEKLLLNIDPLKMGVIEKPFFGLEGALRLDDDSMKKLYSSGDCGVFEKLEIFRALIAGNSEQKWPEKLEGLLSKKILLTIQAQTVGIPTLLQVYANSSILKSATESGIFSDFSSEAKEIYNHGTERMEKRKKLFKDQHRLAWEYEFRSSIQLQSKLNTLLQKIWSKELGI